MGLVALCAMLFLAACGSSAGTGSGGNAREEGSPDAAGSSGETGDGGGTEGNPTLGAADAPVVMVEWGDFQ